ncbi:MAG: imidazole glycerol phosphate synthase subunit HisH [Actinomycetia bacterium]|nr:imidazole glycerol phosphate synthase subunit HisH [Actinomycetes bacterium]
MIAILDYGMGNLRSVQKAFEKVGVEAAITADPDEALEATALVLPGVGGFSDAMAHLKSTGLHEVIIESINKGRMFLGICLGLQLLFERSFEDGEHLGLGVFEGTVERLPEGVKIPHMGWNQIEKTRDLPLLGGIDDGTNFYFVHSYVVRPKNLEIVATVTDYGKEFVSGVSRDNVFAFQFHPEKSGSVGLSILKNFGDLCQQ